MPVSLDATADVRDGVALVTARLTNPGPVARGVRLRNRLDGPVLPPRRRGVPAEGWSDDGFAGTVPAEGELAVGYACPLDGDPTAEPPVELVSVGAPRSTSASSGPPAERARRDLPPARPPRDAVPDPRSERGRPADDPGRDERVRDAPTRVDGDDRPDPVTRSTADRPDATASDPEPKTDPRAPPSDQTPAATGADVDAYLDTVERRVALGERLTGASVPEATAALAEADPEAVAVGELPATLAADAEALAALAERADRLATRARATDVPVDALRRLA